jgi:hypothetical protein
VRSLETVLKIRQDEQEAFVRFTKRFFKMVKEFEKDLESEQSLSLAIEAVDDAVRELEDRYKIIKQKRLHKYLEAGVSLGLSTLCLFLPSEISKLVAALFSGKAGSSLFKAFSEYRLSYSEIRQSVFYIPWLIAQGE